MSCGSLGAKDYCLAFAVLIIPGLALYEVGGRVPFDRVENRRQHAKSGRVFHGNASNYLEVLKQLTAGDTLLLEPGEYGETKESSGLLLFHLNGSDGKPITISGLEAGPRPVFLGQPDRNTVRIGDSSFLILRHLDLDGRNQPGIDAIKSEDVSHHITIDDLTIRNYQGDQGDVGISTKAPAWDWVIRNTRIQDVGTGMYLGNSDGQAPFVRGLIECNVVVGTIGYNIQIKHQNPRPDVPGIPVGPSATIIRRNVFDKSKGGARGHMSRPNLLIGHFPPAGPGMDDVYEIYGNLFYQNPTRECLLQGEGNVALYANVFFNPLGSAICIQPHNDVPREIHVFHNTVVARDNGIRITGGDPRSRQVVQANAVFALTPIFALRQSGNIARDFADARKYLSRPQGNLGDLDLYPLPGKLKGAALSLGQTEHFHDASLDFNGEQYQKSFRGAYSGEGNNPRKLPAAGQSLCHASE